MIVTTNGSAWYEEDEDTGRKVWAICQEEQIETRMRRKLIPYNYAAELPDQDVFVDDVVEENQEEALPDPAENEIEHDAEGENKKVKVESVNEAISTSPPV